MPASHLLYQLHEWQSAALMPVRLMAAAGHQFLRHPMAPHALAPFGGGVATALEVFELATRYHRKPAFGVDSVVVGGAAVPLREVDLCRKPFCTLRHFRCERAGPAPKVLLVAPMSGHFATELREMIAALSSDHEVYLTDWSDAREVPLAEGSFDLDDYIDYVLDFLRLLAPELHVIGICQSTVPVLAASALMAAEDDPARPCSMALFAGPIDPRFNPTAIDMLATSHPLDWFERTQIATVPSHYPGAGRRVHPGFIQRTTFMSMNVDRLAELNLKLLDVRLRGDDAEAAACQRFYQEYLAVMDLTAEFYLQTVKTVFQDRALPRGEMTWRGRKVDPAAIQDTALLTIEGGRDDVSGRGQTDAAHDLCANIPAARKHRTFDPRADHVDLFTGGEWRQRILPKVRTFIAGA
jgi:poly(3-hydroxybutyrate) depolymerase